MDVEVDQSGVLGADIMIDKNGMPEKKRAFALVLILVTFLVSYGCQTSTHGGVENADVVHETVIEVHNDFVVTPIRLFDVTTQAVVDTGAELSILPPNLFPHIEPDVIGYTDLNIVFFDRELRSTPVVLVPVVEWAGSTYRDVLFAIPDQDVWNSVFDGSSVIIGGNLLARNTIEFNFPQRTMRVTQNGHDADPFLDENDIGWSTIPIVELSINNNRMPALIDTGANRTSISSQALSTRGLELEPVADRLYLFDGAEERESLVPVAGLRWGEIVIEDVLVRSAETGYAVIIGMDILSRLSLSISYCIDGPVITVESSPVGSFGLASMNSPQFGFSLGLGDDGVFSVVTVIEPSLAHSAGIRPGDKINAVLPAGGSGPRTPITDPLAIGEYLSSNQRVDLELVKSDTETVVTVSISKMAIVHASTVAP